MRAIFTLVTLAVLALSLGGCAVAEVAGAGVSVATTVVTTTVDVAGDVVGGVADTVCGHPNDDKDKAGEKDKPRDDGDNDNDNAQ